MENYPSFRKKPRCRPKNIGKEKDEVISQGSSEEEQGRHIESCMLFGYQGPMSF